MERLMSPVWVKTGSPVAVHHVANDRHQVGDKQTVIICMEYDMICMLHGYMQFLQV